MCGVVPSPPDPKLTVPGLALAIAITSLTDCAGTEGFTTRTSGETAAIEIPAKSLAGSSEIFR